MSQPEPSILKRAARGLYGKWCDLRTWPSSFAPQVNGVAVHYAGAKKWGAGGPRVKVRRLIEYFPESNWRFNLVYALSSSPYLSENTILRLKRRGIPIVHNQNGTFYPAWYGGDWRAENQRMAYSYHLADVVFYQSRYCQEAARQHLGEREGAGEVLYNAVDTKRFAPKHSKKNDDSIRFLLTGRFGGHHHYRLETAIAGLHLALCEGLNARLIIAGQFDPQSIHQIQEQINRLRIQDAVTILGPYSQDGAPKIYQGSDVFLTTTHQDSCPNAVLEAMACGLPVLHSGNGGVPELTGPNAGVGLGCPSDWETPRPPSAEAVGQGMIVIAKTYKPMGRAARDRVVERFDLKPWIRRHQEVFQFLLNES